MTTKDRLESQITFELKDLANRCRDLATSMNTLAKRLERPWPHSNILINDHGEIQSEGTFIDTECSRISTMIAMWRMLVEEN